MSVAKRRNRISGQFAARLIEMLKSPAYRALSASGHKVISRIEIELAPPWRKRQRTSASNH